MQIVSISDQGLSGQIHLRYKGVDHAWPNMNFLAFLIHGRSNSEDVQDRGDGDKQRSVRKVDSRAYSDSASAAAISNNQKPGMTNLLPKPKTKEYGSRTWGSILPSFRKRSGRNSSGSSYTFGSCIQALKCRTLIRTPRPG